MITCSEQCLQVRKRERERERERVYVRLFWIFWTSNWTMQWDRFLTFNWGWPNLKLSFEGDPNGPFVLESYQISSFLERIRDTDSISFLSHLLYWYIFADQSRGCGFAAPEAWDHCHFSGTVQQWRLWRRKDNQGGHQLPLVCGVYPNGQTAVHTSRWRKWAQVTLESVCMCVCVCVLFIVLFLSNEPGEALNIWRKLTSGTDVTILDFYSCHWVTQYNWAL